jgi:hypothetical protein
MADLREALTTALNAQEEVQTEQTPVIQDTPVETTEQREARQRDESGRFKAKDDAVDVTAKTIDAPAPRKAPSSWKKDYWEAYEKLDPKLAEYIDTREQQFASGVSTYKQEAERAKEIFEAIAPFQQDLQQHGVAPTQWIRNLGLAHQTLVRGSPEQKLQAFQKLAHDYGVPLQSVITGQMDPMMQYLSPLQEQVRQLEGKLTGWQETQQKQEQTVIQSEIEQFSTQHEHFDAVKETMAGLLQAGLAQDLKSAYDKAIRMNDDLWTSAQQQKTADAERQHRESAKAKVNQARANTVSPRSATPIGAMSSSGKKDLRSQLEEAVDATLGGARV